MILELTKHVQGSTAQSGAMVMKKCLLLTKMRVLSIFPLKRDRSSFFLLIISLLRQNVGVYYLILDTSNSSVSKRNICFHLLPTPKWPTKRSGSGLARISVSSPLRVTVSHSCAKLHPQSWLESCQFPADSIFHWAAEVFHPPSARTDPNWLPSGNWLG